MDLRASEFGNWFLERHNNAVEEKMRSDAEEAAKQAQQEWEEKENARVCEPGRILKNLADHKVSVEENAQHTLDGTELRVTKTFELNKADYEGQPDLQLVITIIGDGGMPIDHIDWESVESAVLSIRTTDSDVLPMEEVVACMDSPIDTSSEGFGIFFAQAGLSEGVREDRTNVAIGLLCEAADVLKIEHMSPDDILKPTPIPQLVTV